MLKGIPACIDSNLLKALYDMGHGDRLVIADHYYPAFSKGTHGTVIQAKGCSVPELLEAILVLFPLDNDYCKSPVKIMKPDSEFSELCKEPFPIWSKIESVVHMTNPSASVEYIDRSSFYLLAETAYLTISTSEQSTYSCIILQKGVK